MSKACFICEKETINIAVVALRRPWKSLEFWSGDSIWTMILTDYSIKINVILFWLQCGDNFSLFDCEDRKIVLFYQKQVLVSRDRNSRAGCFTDNSCYDHSHFRPQCISYQFKLLYLFSYRDLLRNISLPFCFTRPKTLPSSPLVCFLRNGVSVFAPSAEAKAVAEYISIGREQR